MQIEASHHAKAAAATESPDPDPTLDALIQMNTRELEARYRKGRVPDSLEALNGSPPGRMLAVGGGADRGVAGNAIRRFAGSNVFPWHGKTFHADHTERGTGINRVAVLGERFPFETRIEPSAIDGKPCILLDYDKPENPFFIRAVRDELREIAPGLFLGPAMIKTRRGPRTVLFFAVDKT